MYSKVIDKCHYITSKKKLHCDRIFKAIRSVSELTKYCIGSFHMLTYNATFPTLQDFLFKVRLINIKFTSEVCFFELEVERCLVFTARNGISATVF